MTRAAALAVVAAVLASLAMTACGGDPPQIVDYAPQRSTIDVSTAIPIRITFDHEVDQASVNSRLHLSPAAQGIVRWIDSRHLVYEHATLRTNTVYEGTLQAG